MHVKPRLLLLPGLLLLAGASFAFAESPTPDPIAPAVIGRPLPDVKPVRNEREKPAQATAAPGKEAKQVAGKEAKAAAGAGKEAKQATGAGKPARATTPAVATAAPATAGAQRQAKQAVDDHADPNQRVEDNVGQGTHFARKRLAPGVYFREKHRTAVRKYYERHPAPDATAQWQIGETLPRGAPVAAVPKGLLASLPDVPPGHRYVQIGGEVVLIAAGSRMVVDGISRKPR